MNIRMEWRDHLPKMGLSGRYIGDGYPLCSDLPDKHFLKTGAAYRLLGVYKKPVLHQENRDWTDDGVPLPLPLDQRSGLFQALCGGVSGSCNYKSKIVLDSDIACFGDECNIESARVVEVEEGIFYEYVRVPCVNQAFYNGGYMLKPWRWTFACGDPRMELGGVGCCPVGSHSGIQFDHRDPNWFVFSGERVKFATANAKCQSLGLALCPRTNFVCEEECDDSNHDYWTSTQCGIQAKLNLDGTVAIVHDVPGYNEWVRSTARDNTKTFFRADWETPIEGNILDNYESACDNLGCPRDTQDNLCLCDATVEESIVFSSRPSRDEVLNELPIGAFSPLLYGKAGVVETDSGDGVTVYDIPSAPYSSETIFSVVDDYGVTHFRKNLKSIVRIGNAANLELRFRNPNHFFSISDPTQRDAQYETEAALDHYFVSRKKAHDLWRRNDLVANCFGFSRIFSFTVEMTVSSKRCTLPCSSFCPTFWNIQPFSTLR